MPPPSHGGKAQNCLSCAHRLILLATGATRGKPQRKRANCLLRFTAGSPKGSDTRDLKEAKTLLEQLSA